MMFLEILKSRRSIRKYEERPVEPEKIEQLIEAALRSPSGRSINPWAFIVVDDREKLDRLSRSKPHGAAFLKGAPLGIVVCADTSKSDTCVEDASIASIFIHLAAASLGLGSCWIQIHKRTREDDLTAEQYVAREIGIPDGMMVQSIIAVGYPDETKAGHSKDKLLYDKVHFNTYGTPRPWRV
jgi:nitroreductase